MTNKYLNKIAELTMPAMKVTSKVNHIAGVPSQVSAGGVKGSVFGKTLKAPTIPALG